MKTIYYKIFLLSSPKYFVAIKKLHQQSIVYPYSLSRNYGQSVGF